MPPCPDSAFSATDACSVRICRHACVRQQSGLQGDPSVCVVRLYGLFRKANILPRAVFCSSRVFPFLKIKLNLARLYNKKPKKSSWPTGKILEFTPIPKPFSCPHIAGGAALPFPRSDSLSHTSEETVYQILDQS